MDILKVFDLLLCRGEIWDLEESAKSKERERKWQGMGGELLFLLCEVCEKMTLEREREIECVLFVLCTWG